MLHYFNQGEVTGAGRDNNWVTKILADLFLVFKKIKPLNL